MHTPFRREQNRLIDNHHTILFLIYNNIMKSVKMKNGNSLVLSGFNQVYQVNEALKTTSGLIIIVLQVKVVKIYATIVEALKKNKMK
jgi:hypothetical protein